MLAFADMMRKQIVMPAHLMDDGRHGEMNGGRNLFEDFAGEPLGGVRWGVAVTPAAWVSTTAANVHRCCKSESAAHNTARHYTHP
jgi:hypothetical protein